MTEFYAPSYADRDSAFVGLFVQDWAGNASGRGPVYMVPDTLKPHVMKVGQGHFVSKLYKAVAKAANGRDVLRREAACVLVDRMLLNVAGKPRARRFEFGIVAQMGFAMRGEDSAIAVFGFEQEVQSILSGVKEQMAHEGSKRVSDAKAYARLLKDIRAGKYDNKFQGISDSAARLILQSVHSNRTIQNDIPERVAFAERIALAAGFDGIEILSPQMTSVWVDSPPGRVKRLGRDWLDAHASRVTASPAQGTQADLAA